MTTTESTPSVASNKKKLTARFLASLKPAEPGRRRVIWDTELPGFAVRSTDRGRHSFVVGKRPHGGKQFLWTLIGDCAVMSLADAREAARAALKTLSEGKDPKVVRQQEAEAARLEEARREAGTFANVVERYIADRLPKLRTGKVIEQMIRRDLMVLGKRPIGEITRAEVRELINTIRATGAKSTIPGTRRRLHGGEASARKALSTLTAFFDWCDELVEVNPCSGLEKKLDPPVARQRVLDAAEIKLLWQVATEEKYPNGPLLQVLLLTGQRLREIGDMRWSEIAGDVLTIPAARMKGRNDKARAHSVPLTPKVMELLDAVPRTGDFVFTKKDSRKAVNGFDRLKQRVDRELAAKLGDDTKLFRERWTFHDLRRTCRTGLAETGATPFVGELVIGHVQGGVHAVYDLHKYDQEKRDALMRWEARVMSIVAPTEPTDNVYPLRKAG
jgi:integrase